ncbi:MAG: 16S rRNA (uracil(1498)-N(3))-methyltransferase, partial [Candidatus Omnitrophica bacterium]|nr:16S rRNA (uracil(1498)-N(3))-methyltransferase [Candidatus Omnitrophota bacterium]
MRIRCFAPPSAWGAGDLIRLTGGEAHHLADVLRAKPGLQVTCFDGEGLEAEALVRRVSRKEVFLQLQGKRLAEPSGTVLTLAVAPPAHGKLGEIVNQATQLGAQRILPLLTARTVVKISPGDWARKEERLRQIVIEAGKQSGLSRLPALLAPIAFRDLIRKSGEYGLLLLAAVEGPHEKLSTLLSGRPSG